ncbi:hypothetical protein EV361DRAFT_386253 [Lentinula raphanica]|uniref:Uncharacterized protein n=1 Tax=Lentinula raphanica TaxID=153919 RepID=A0AA38P4V5_9AGAR|nr:hypothetical protein F5880DRAFT_1269709 [Lentinula raphanica]KAJ3836231.1 hypothetical protein F5878DRAFT_272378 [Lentinula raphanica]KAJ3968895.1 hypothetical protein EV361DRAFT_386253 [Lentinula raphanica]
MRLCISSGARAPILSCFFSVVVYTAAALPMWQSGQYEQNGIHVQGPHAAHYAPKSAVITFDQPLKEADAYGVRPGIENVVKQRIPSDTPIEFQDPQTSKVLAEGQIPAWTKDYITFRFVLKSAVSPNLPVLGSGTGYAKRTLVPGSNLYEIKVELNPDPEAQLGRDRFPVLKPDGAYDVWRLGREH